LNPKERSAETERRLLSLIGLGARAGRLAIGVEAAHRAINAGKAEMIIMPADASPRSKDQLVLLAGHRKVPLLIAASAERLGAILGRPPVHGVAVLDRQLAKGLRVFEVPKDPKEKTAG
jgi:ribosomal protein L7Ae-like RNA K-turn-binding protein